MATFKHDIRNKLSGNISHTVFTSSGSAPAHNNGWGLFPSTYTVESKDISSEIDQRDLDVTKRKQFLSDLKELDIDSFTLTQTKAVLKKVLFLLTK